MTRAGLSALMQGSRITQPIKPEPLSAVFANLLDPGRRVCQADSGSLFPVMFDGGNILVWVLGHRLKSRGQFGATGTAIRALTRLPTFC